MTHISTWIDEYHKGSRFGLNGEILIKQKSKYQEIIVIENEYYGRALMLDGCWMTSLKDEKYYHECLVHPALSSIDEKSNILIIGGGDGGTARECLKYSQVEIIDLRTLNPLDMDIIEKSLSKTGKVIIVYEDNLTNGPGAEIAAKVSDDFFELLDGPVSRVAAKDSPVPFNWFLEEKILPQIEDIAESIKELMEY